MVCVFVHATSVADVSSGGAVFVMDVSALTRRLHA